MNRAQVLQESQSLSTGIAVDLWYRNSFVDQVFAHVHVRVILIRKALIFKGAPNYHQASLLVRDAIESTLRTITVKGLPAEGSF